jgi:3-hydroxymyristoyl/3-hydroxydecanoyl-(acyl carrier protein) dehydratase
MTTSTEILIPPDHPAFAGHFPGTPIVPGVVLLDEALLAIAALGGVSADRCVISSVKFTSVVRPGEAVTLRFEFVRPNSIRFELQSGDRPVARGALMVASATGTTDDH